MVRPNNLLRDFTARMDAKFAEDSERMSMSEYIIQNTHLKKKPFKFDDYWFQRQICDDMHPNLVCIKCSQVGLTEIQLRKFLCFLKRTTAINGIFTLPNDKMRGRTSQTRVKPLIESEKIFNMGPDKPVRSVGLYQIDHSFAFFTGNTEGDATSINADILFHDEVDLSDQPMLGLFSSRLQNSDFKIKQSFSTPTLVGFGIDAQYNISDQHEYMCRCEACNHWQVPTLARPFVHLPGLPDGITRFDEIDTEVLAQIDLENAYIKCENCDRRLDLGNPSLREWVAAFPGRATRGYRVRPFSTSRITLPYVLTQLVTEYKAKDNLRGWYNTVLGEPYNDSNARLTETDIRAVMKGPNQIELPQGAEVYIGIDVGATCHVTIARIDASGRPIVFRWMQVPADTLVPTVQMLCEQYTVVAGCMDRNPYTPTAMEVMDVSDGRIVPVEYTNSAVLSFEEDELGNFTHIKAHRTAMIDAVNMAVRKYRISLVGYAQYERMIIDHLMDMVRIETPDEPAKWMKIRGQDHFFHSLAFLLLSIKMVTIRNQLSDDNRAMVLVGTSTMMHHGGAALDVRTRRKAPISMGII